MTIGKTREQIMELTHAELSAWQKYAETRMHGFGIMAEFDRIEYMLGTIAVMIAKGMKLCRKDGRQIELDDVMLSSVLKKHRDTQKGSDMDHMRKILREFASK